MLISFTWTTWRFVVTQLWMEVHLRWSPSTAHYTFWAFMFEDIFCRKPHLRVILLWQAAMSTRTFSVVSHSYLGMYRFRLVDLRGIQTYFLKIKSILRKRNEQAKRPTRIGGQTPHQKVMQSWAMIPDIPVITMKIVFVWTDFLNRLFGQFFVLRPLVNQMPKKWQGLEVWTFGMLLWVSFLLGWVGWPTDLFESLLVVYPK